MAAVIGILDSGLGGLTVARRLEALLPGADLIYLGDTARFPYGNKSIGRIADRVRLGMDMLKGRGAELIVLACGTGSAAWLSSGKQKPDVRVVDAVTAAVDRVLTLVRCRRIGVVGTPAFVRTGVFSRMLGEKNPELRVHAQEAPLLVPLIEDGRLQRPEVRMIVKKYLHPLKVRQVDTLVLGCNHYGQVKQLMQRKIGSGTRLIDCASVVADSARASADRHLLPSQARRGTGGSRAYYLTDITDRSVAVGRKMFGRNLAFTPWEL